MAASDRPREGARQDTLCALMAAALALPGLVGTPPAHAEESVSMQAARLQEGPRRLGGGLPAPRPITVDMLSWRASTDLDNRLGLQIGYAQDTWSGATPVSTAPRSAGANRPVQQGPAGALVTVGASPMLTGRVLLDAQDRPLLRDAATGRLTAAPELVHTMSSASPETRRQLDLKLTRAIDSGQATLGLGASQERDHHAQFVHLGQRIDDGLWTHGWSLSATRSRIAATLDHDAAPYLTKTAYRSQIETVGGLQILHGRRTEVSASASSSRVLGPATLASATLSLTHGRGDLANPYKATSVIFVPPSATPAAADEAATGDLRSLLEQRPRQRTQWNVGAKLVQHVAGPDAALHLGASFFGDNWGVRGQRLEAEWIQPLSLAHVASQASVRLRHHSQGAARFYRPYLVSHQAYRQLSVSPDGQVSTRDFDPSLLPAWFSSDPRLAGYGVLTAGAGWSRRLDNGMSLDVSFERSLSAGRLKWGGGGEGRYADFGYWLAQASVSLSFEPMAPTRPTVDAHDPGHDGHDAHRAPAAHHHEALPAELSLAHGPLPAGGWMLGYRWHASSSSGTLQRGGTSLDDAAVRSGGCGPSACVVAPTSMGMRMHMLELMHGLNERWSLMLMPQWVDMRMDTRLLAGAVAGDAPVHVGRHESAGLGDTQAHVLHHGRVGTARWVLGLGLSAPTGRTDLHHRRSHQQDGAAMDYAMQTGTGTWELLPSASLVGGTAAWTWGLHATAASRLQAANEEGYAQGLRWQSHAWVGARLWPGLTGTLRAAWRRDHGIRGARRDAATLQLPPEATANHGGQMAELGLGLSMALGGAAADGAVALERLQPWHTELRGVQLPPRGRWVLAWSHRL